MQQQDAIVDSAEASVPASSSTLRTEFAWTRLSQVKVTVGSNLTSPSMYEAITTSNAVPVHSTTTGIGTSCGVNVLHSAVFSVKQHIQLSISGQG